MLLSDISIAKRCEPPTHALTVGGYHQRYVSPPFTDEEITILNGGVRGVAMVKLDEVGLPDVKPMLEPFYPESVRRAEDGTKIASFGLSSFGYDIRCGRKFKLFSNVHAAGEPVDYKKIDRTQFVDLEGDMIVIPPNSFVLSHSEEYLRVPRDCLVLCTGKSTLARAGISVLSTPLEPEWEGYVTLEFANTTNLPVRLYAGEGAVQLLFLQGDRDCRTSYADRGGKYQAQERDIVLPRM